MGYYNSNGEYIETKDTPTPVGEPPLTPTPVRDFPPAPQPVPKTDGYDDLGTVSAMVLASAVIDLELSLKKVLEQIEQFKKAYSNQMDEENKNRGK